MDAPDARPEFSRGATFDAIIKYEIVRIADEFVVDLLTKACGITYEQATAQIEKVEIHGVLIPFLKLELLIKTKDTYRPKDAADRAYLQELIAHEKESEKKKTWWRW